MINVLGVWEKINDFAGSFKDFMFSNDRNPIVYTGLFLLGLAVFGFAYSKLHKDN